MIKFVMCITRHPNMTREAVDRGCWCLTVADCCATSDLGMHDAALALIAGEGHLFGWVSNAGDIQSGMPHMPILFNKLL